MSYPPYPGTPDPAAGYPSYPGTPQPAAGYPPPPGWVPMAPPEPARGLMIASIVIAAAFTAAEVIEAILAWFAQSEYINAADNGVMSYDVWTPYDFAAIPMMPLGIAAYVITCLWLYKVRTNAEALFPAGRHARSQGWVWGGWIVPVVNLWFPFQVVRDIARDPREVIGTPLIGWWWTFWLLSTFTIQIGSQLLGPDEIHKSLVSALGTVETINALFTVVALVLWLKIIRRIGRLQDEFMGIVR